MSEKPLLLVRVCRDERFRATGVIDKSFIFGVRDRIAIYTESAGVSLAPIFALVPTVGACHFSIEPISVFSFLICAPHPKLAGRDIDLFGAVWAVFRWVAAIERLLPGK